MIHDDDNTMILHDAYDDDLKGILWPFSHQILCISNIRTYYTIFFPYFEPYFNLMSRILYQLNGIAETKLIGKSSVKMILAICVSIGLIIVSYN